MLENLQMKVLENKLNQFQTR